MDCMDSSDGRDMYAPFDIDSMGIKSPGVQRSEDLWENVHVCVHTCDHAYGVGTVSQHGYVTVRYGNSGRT